MTKGADKVARASSPAGFGGVPPPGRNILPGGTPGSLAGADACVTLVRLLTFAYPTPAALVFNTPRA